MSKITINADFYKGFAVAVGALARNGYPSMAVDIMKCYGVHIRDLEDADCEAFDLDPIREEVGEKRGKGR